MDKLFEIKEDIDLKDLQKLHPAIFIIFGAAILYCKRNNLTCRITSIISDRGNVNAVSKTHESGRAIDIGVRKEDGFTEMHAHRLCFQLNRDYSELAAISYSDHNPRAAIFKNNHIHLQCRNISNQELNKFIKE